MAEDETAGPQSLLPYDEWTEAALRQVLARALEHVQASGLPGGHHFYITFRTDRDDVEMPEWLRQKYPDEITIVLQNRFWDLKVSPERDGFQVGLSFGGVGTMLRVPLDAVTGFADPHVRFGLRFRPVGAPAEPAAPAAEQPAASLPAEAAEEPPPAAPQVVSLDAFRRRPPAKQ